MMHLKAKLRGEELQLETVGQVLNEAMSGQCTAKGCQRPALMAGTRCSRPEVSVDKVREEAK
jgi:hypothetical protein